MLAFTWDVDPLWVHFPSTWARLPVDGIRYYSLLYVLVFLGGYKLLDWQLRRAGADPEDAHDFVLYGVVAVLVGARLGHVLFYEWQRVVRDPLWSLEIHHGGLSSHGAALGLAVAMFAYTRRRRQSFVEGCDRFAFSAALGAILVRIGNLFNSEIVGKPTGSSWGVRFPRYDGYLDPPLRHPTQIYEALLGLCVLVLLLWADRRLGKERRPRGALISVFLALYFSGRFVLEFWKEVPLHETAAGLDAGQWLSIAPALAGWIGCSISRQRRIPARWNTIANVSDGTRQALDSPQK
ncbi:MAG TPA: prolipoprotein diacylglyceryl transferase [Polyangiaceae bacterium]|nr:prolipoprotein diacylglyceryl transferase [Polyangiaceae bacterium]